MARKLRQKKTINNLIVISDTHCGCRFGLCPPTPVPLDGGGFYQASKMQKTVWSWWQEFLGDWVPMATRGEPFAVVMNGDAIDGIHHGSVTQISQNLQDQVNLAYSILKPVVELCEGRYYHIRGTEAHVGKSSQEEERLATLLGAVPDEIGQRSRYELWVRVGKGLVNIAHHIGTSGSMHYESTAVMRELTEAYVEAGRWMDEAPDVVCRSHRHRNVEVRVRTSKGFATACTTAAWQLKTPYAYRIAGARQSLPQIGGTLIRAGDEEVYTRHQVWSLSRSKEVTL